MSGDTVQLWDGKNYDASHLESLCPGIVEYSREHDVLTERLEMTDLTARQKQKPVKFRTSIIAFSLLIVVVALACLVSGVPISAIVLVVICVSVVSLILLFANGVSRFRGKTLPESFHDWSRQLPPGVHVSGSIWPCPACIDRRAM